MSKKLEREPISMDGPMPPMCSRNADERQFQVALCLSLVGLGVCIAASVAQLALVGCYVLTIRKHCEVAAVSEGEKCGNDARSHLKIVHIN